MQSLPPLAYCTFFSSQLLWVYYDAAVRCNQVLKVDVYIGCPGCFRRGLVCLWGGYGPQGCARAIAIALALATTTTITTGHCSGSGHATLSHGLPQTSCFTLISYLGSVIIT